VLARPANQTAGPGMIPAREGPDSRTECSLHPGAGQQESSCDVREPWQRINDAVHAALAKITLADLATPRGSSGILDLHSLGVRLDAAGME